MYCFCQSARFTGGYLATPHTDVIEISLKFERTHHDDSCNSNDKCNLNFLELSDKTLHDVCANRQVHECVRDLLHQALLLEKTTATPTAKPAVLLTSPIMTPTTTTNVIVHQTDVADSDGKDKIEISRNSSKRSSMKSSKSMETILDKTTGLRIKDKSPDEDHGKAKSVGNINDDEAEEDEYIENGESIELIFISDEFVNKVQRQDSVIIVDEKDGKRRESLTNNKKIVIITDEYKDKVLRNNSIVVTGEKKALRKLRKAKTFNTNSNSYLSYDEPADSLEDKRFIRDK